MSLIKVNIENLQNIQDKIDKNNASILDNMKIIDKELEEITSILSTPKSTTVIPSFLEYWRGKEEFVQNQNDVYHHKFNNIINKYIEFSNEIEKMVGDKVD